MAAALPALAVGSGALSAFGAIQQGQMTSNSLNAQAQMQLAQANEAESAGQFNAMRESMLAAQKIGSATAAYGASGVTSGSGSETAVLEASAANSELDRLNILHGADVKAINYRNQAALDEYGGSAAVSGSYLSALGNLTSGVLKAVTMGQGPGGGENPGSGMSSSLTTDQLGS